MRIIGVAAARAGMVDPVLITRTWRLVTGFAAPGWVPARAAGLRGECPPASAFGECLLLYFAPKACRPRRDVGLQACRRAELPSFAPGRRRLLTPLFERREEGPPQRGRPSESLSTAGSLKRRMPRSPNIRNGIDSRCMPRLTWPAKVRVAPSSEGWAWG